MKKVIPLLFNLLLATITFAQGPMAIKYQAVVRNANGEILLNQSISMRISILDDSTSGNVLYSEIHIITTNSYGLVNLEIGRGTSGVGNFGNIDWSQGNYFVKVEADENGGNNFSLLGTSQLLSVPYAMYANSAGMPHLTDNQRDSIPNPSKGMVIYNLTTNCINIYRGDNWFQVCGDCVPQPTFPYAGSDVVSCFDTIVQLDANTPIKGVGTWSIYSGEGGNFSDIHDAQCIFTGISNQTYWLSWDISTSCNSWHDYVIIDFAKIPIANAGPDIKIYGSYGIGLSANQPGNGQGLWTIEGGYYGTIYDGSYPNSYYYPSFFMAGRADTLQWTIWNECDTSYDEMVIRFCPNYASANAGSDLILSAGTSCGLQGNAPLQLNSGFWTVISGAGGSFLDSTLNNTIFTGQENTTYTLRWTLQSICDTSFDEVNIITGSLLTTNDSITYEGQTYHIIQIGTQYWLKENLNIGNMIFSYFDQADNGELEKHCWDNDPAFCEIYGGLYQWNELMNYTTTEGSQGICPSGWHIPSKSDFDILVNFLGGSGIAGGKMKETAYNHWASPNQGATNECGFTALGAGMSRFESFYGLNEYTRFWTSTPYSQQCNWFVELNNSNTTINVTDGGFYCTDFTGDGYSVRCIKDTCNLSPTGSEAGQDINSTDTTTTLNGNVPVTGTGIWNIINGTGGVINEPNNPNSAFSGDMNNAYILTWTISTECLSSIDTVIITFSPAGICGLDFTDTRDGQTYGTVQIGTQCWMKQNLNIGDMITSNPSNNSIIEKYCYSNNSNNCQIYGGLYQWDEMMGYSSDTGTQGICPAGYHVPTLTEFQTLVNYLGGSNLAGGKMKEEGFTHWVSPNFGASNLSGFTAMGCGYFVNNGYSYFDHLNEYSAFWCSTQEGTSARILYLSSWAQDAGLLDDYKTEGLSVRCIKN